MNDTDRHLLMRIALVAGVFLIATVLWPTPPSEPVFHPMIWPLLALVTVWGFWRAIRNGSPR